MLSTVFLSLFFSIEYLAGISTIQTNEPAAVTNPIPESCRFKKIEKSEESVKRALDLSRLSAAKLLPDGN